jgi:hypothetical protein
MDCGLYEWTVTTPTVDEWLARDFTFAPELIVRVTVYRCCVAPTTRGLSLPARRGGDCHAPRA